MTDERDEIEFTVRPHDGPSLVHWHGGRMERERELMAEVKRLKERNATLETERNHAKGQMDAAQPVLEAVRLWMLAKVGSRASMGALLVMQRAARAYQAEQQKIAP